MFKKTIQVLRVNKTNLLPQTTSYLTRYFVEKKIFASKLKALLLRERHETLDLPGADPWLVIR